ncbi:MAG: sulfite exporter TauE/SafE family protein [Phycisphaerales bacterium JB040]
MTFAVLGALVVGLSLGLFGSGGSILTVPILIYLLHHEDKAAIAESLAIVGAIALVSALPYARAGLVEWRTVVLFGLPGMAGTYLGAWLAALVAGYVQLLVFAGVMLLAAAQMWRRSRANADGPEPAAPTHRPVARIVGDGLGVGVLTGFVGVGGGFLIVPALVLLGGLTMRRAVATSLVIIALKSGAGFWKYLDVLDRAGGGVDWATIGLFVLLGGVGSLAGKAVNDKVNQRALQRGFAVFLTVMAGFILVKESLPLLSPPDSQPTPTTHGDAP